MFAALRTLVALARRPRGDVALSVHPVRIVPAGFALVIALGTALLMLPAASADGTSAPLLTAIFTAVSGTCVTGLVTVDTGSFWSPLGQAIILGLIQIGGLGTLLVTTLLLMLVQDRLSIADRLRASAENRGLGLGSTEDRIRTVITYTLVTEAIVALALTGWFTLMYDMPWSRAAWLGVFHAVSAFNNAGFGLRPDSLMGFAADPFVLGMLSVSVVLGGIGLPVIAEVRARWRAGAAPRPRRAALALPARPPRWSLHTQLTLIGTIALLLLGTVTTWAFDTRADGALAGLSTPVAAMNAAVHSVMLRTAGFNAIDIAALSDASILTGCILMIIGGGSIGTAGGIKVTTLMVLLIAVWAEVRGRQETRALRRRLPTALLREALAILVLAVVAVTTGALVILATSALPLRDALFEASSAFATVGLSTGITAQLNVAGQVAIMALMFIGRIGPITLGAALALKVRPAPIHHPEERCIVG